jgi:phospholipid/cholesterol/gamma-HCH transport system ATP-binding protein
VISMRGVKMSFGDINILNDINFSIARGERVSLIGPGGSGKSTILKLLLGLLPPTAGEIVLMDTDMVRAEEQERLETLRRVGMAFQQGALFDFMTVAENLTFAMEHMTDLKPEAMAKRIDSLLAGVKLSRTKNMFPFELSGGMQRRVGIARALATDPVVSIFDEPTAGLDPVTSTIILNMIADLAGAGEDRAQLVVTSNVEIGIRFADRLLVLNEGRIVADGPWRELLLHGSDWVRNFLGVRLIGLDLEYAQGLKLPSQFIAQHWT